MLSHADIWSAIDRLAAQSGLSASGLARRSGLDPTSFNRSKRHTSDGRPRWPSTESLAKVLAASGATLAEFAVLTGASPAVRRIPVVGYAQAGRHGFFDEAGYPAGTGWDEIAFPDPGPAPADERVYALKVAGDSMAPLYRDGDLIVVAPGASIRRGDRVVLRTKQGEVMAKELARRTAQLVELRSLNPAHPPLRFAPGEVAWMSRIVWASQ